MGSKRRSLRTQNATFVWMLKLKWKSTPVSTRCASPAPRQCAVCPHEHRSVPSVGLKSLGSSPLRLLPDASGRLYMLARSLGVLHAGATCTESGCFNSHTLIKSALFFMPESSEFSGVCSPEMSSQDHMTIWYQQQKAAESIELAEGKTRRAATSVSRPWCSILSKLHSSKREFQL